MGHEVVAEVWRGDFLESVHHGTVVATDASGAPALSVGRPDDITFPRSSNKPLQALAMLRSGLDLDGPLLALACASHSGEDFHVAGALEILSSAGLGEEALRCTPDLPLGEQARARHLARGLAAAPKYMNCSGKHAAMLATCAVNGWSTEDYLDPAHPLQVATRRTIEDVAGEPVAQVGVDGCGAPIFAISLTGLARAFGRLASATPGTLEHRVAAAMNAHPEWVGGTGRDVTALMGALPGVIAKDGAEGVYAVGLPSGEGVALKIADGSSRARAVVVIAVLKRLGVDVSAVEDLATVPVLGHGRAVGAVKPSLALAG
ncbi:asparaginase [Lentzea sp. DG1S-22]|uniref:asparaginase n=1 Tax=Lentzea sp. DG1S-22 TaxID=3108822 RepID=UPI002E75FDE0|nr:asparaginase [Lentzea sp. DG1S-22]WVH84461.1 asparaginase [Lentzea sp. DG1S-22]